MNYLKLTSVVMLALASPIRSPLLVGANPQNPESVEITQKDFKQPTSTGGKGPETVGGTGANAQLNFIQPPPPPDVPPEAGRTTGDRGSCPITLTPLIPAEGWGKTASESATVWVYVSYSNGAGATPITGEISIEEKNTNRRLPPGKVSISLPNQSGAFPIHFPSSLAPDTLYRWYLVVDCSNPEDGPTPSFSSVEGLIHREAINTQLPPATTQERLQFYAENGFWYDALNEAGEIYCRQPNDANLANWESLLKAGKLLNEVDPKLLICPPEAQGVE